MKKLFAIICPLVLILSLFIMTPIAHAVGLLQQEITFSRVVDGQYKISTSITNNIGETKIGTVIFSRWNSSRLLVETRLIPFSIPNNDTLEISL